MKTTRDTVALENVRAQSLLHDPRANEIVSVIAPSLGHLQHVHA